MTELIDIPALDFRTWTVQEYQKIVALNILTEEDKVELLNGNIVRMSPVGNAHAAHVDRIEEWIKDQIKKKAIVRVQGPIIADKNSNLEPDIAVLKRKEDFYVSEAPEATDTLLVVEVADSSLTKDREVKGPIYAKGEIMEYWIINLNEEQVEVYREPKEAVYSRVLLLKPGQSFESLLLGTVAVDDLLIAKQ